MSPPLPRSMKVLAALLAAVLVAFLVGLLLLSGLPDPPPAAPVEIPSTAPIPPTPGMESTAVVPSLEAEWEALMGSAEPSATPPPPGEEWIVSGTCLLEDGSPFPGVAFLEMIPGEEEGAWEVDLEADPPVDHGREKGVFHLRWKEPRTEVVLLVLGRTAECVRADGATIVGFEERGEVLRFTPGTEARLVFRPLPGGGLRVNFVTDSPHGAVAVRSSDIRLLDAEGDPLPQKRIGGPLSFWSEGNRSGFRMEVSFPVLTRSERASGDRRVLEFQFPFFESLRLPVADLIEGMMVPLVPLRPTVTGILSPPPSGSDIHGFSIATLTGNASLMDRAVEPGGAFRIYGVPAGEWVLRVMRKAPEGLRWGRRVFRKEEGPVDLGVVEANGWAGLRFRLVDEEGRPMTQASLTVTRVGERDPASLGVFSSFERPGPRGGQILLRDDSLWIQPGKEARDPEGWYEIPDLAPGTTYSVQDTGSPNLKTEVTTPAENGGWAEVELRRKAKER